MIALTLMHGDPSYAGPLAGVPLGLPVYHILEEQVKESIPPDVYEREVGPMEFVLDAPAITAALERAKGERACASSWRATRRARTRVAATGLMAVTARRAELHGRDVAAVPAWNWRSTRCASWRWAATRAGTTGVLTVDAAGLAAHVAPRQGWPAVEIAVARPGEAVRIVHVLDAVEPRCKRGDGAVFPGFFGPPGPWRDGLHPCPRRRGRARLRRRTGHRR